jgi:hypothetical protein
MLHQCLCLHLHVITVHTLYGISLPLLPEVVRDVVQTEAPVEAMNLRTQGGKDVPTHIKDR